MNNNKLRQRCSNESGSIRICCQQDVIIVGAILAIVLSQFLAGCSNTSAPSSTSHTTSPAGYTSNSLDHLVTTQGCGRSAILPPGKSADETLSVNPAEALGRSTRSYRLHIPTSYQKNHLQALVLVFHGYGGNAASMESGIGFSSFADQHDFVVAYPQGLPYGEGGAPFWASVGPMDYGIDDLHYVSSILDDLQSKLCIDAHRIFITGFSNGAGMNGLLACRLARRLAAVAPVSGNFYAIPGGCHPSRPLPIFYVHGSADSVLPYQGSQDTAWSLPSVQQWLQEWVVRDHCRTGPTVFLQNSHFMGEQWTACQGKADIIHYRVEGGGHAWPAMLGSNSGIAVMWNFLQAHPLP